MSRYFRTTRRHLLAIAPAAVAWQFAAPSLAVLPNPSVAELARAAVAGAAPPAVGIVEIVDARLRSPMAFGVRAVGAPDTARIGDCWHIGSNAKSMTATMVARLVERGALSWTAPLERMLPDMDIRDEYRQVTLPDLLSHRAGFDRNSAAGLARMPDNDVRTELERRSDYIAAALLEPPSGPVATGEGAYSNTGFVVAGAIAERVAGQSFEALMRREVFEPLGMETVGFGGTIAGNVAGHREGLPVYGPDGDNPDFLRPAGGLHLSLHDWGAFVLDQLRGQSGKGALLSRESYRFLHAPQGDSQNGLGWGLEPAPDGRPMWSHNGSNGRWFGTVAVFPEEGRAALVVANAAGEEVERVVNRLVVRSLGLA
jgi:CubicO group peptidase (beta-lactamase class C family)